MVAPLPRRGALRRVAVMSRTTNTVVVCPIVYGSTAFYLGKKAEEFHTHRWTLYVRGPQDEDMASFVEKVAFTLHPSFTNPVREIAQAPFEITETGWGEFEAGIRIFFKDPDEQPVDLFHQIRLYPPVGQQQQSAKKPVVAENYDEIVFSDPKQAFHAQLMSYGTPSSPDRRPTAFPEHYAAFDDSLDLELLNGIHAHIEAELAAAKQKLINLDAEVIETVSERKALEAVAAAATAAAAVAAAAAAATAAATAAAAASAAAAALAANNLAGAPVLDSVSMEAC